MIRKLYPGGKRKAFNITYDDGVMQDLRFVELMNRYGIKGTFNLNSELMKTGFTWTHPNGMEVKRLDVDTVRWLYRGHEIASHTRTHPYMHGLTEQEVMDQLAGDKRELEEMLGVEVSGFAVPFDYYSPMIADCAKKCGFEYARMSEFSGSYEPCRNYWFWKTGFYHIEPGLEAFADSFFETEQELAVCQIVGHSYDLDAENLWGTVEEILRRVSRAEDVWSCTNLELVRYLKAMDLVDIHDAQIRNHSGMELWFEIDGKPVCIPPQP